MGGLAKKIPYTAALMAIGTLALTGFPFTAGFYSKDAIIEAAYASHTVGKDFAFICVIVAAFMTSFYSWRLWFLTFWGPTRADHHTYDHAHESPAVMMIPLFVLAAGAILAGFPLKEAFIGHHHDASGRVRSPMASREPHPARVSRRAEVGGLRAAGDDDLGLRARLVHVCPQPATPKRLAAEFPGVYRFLLNKWYFDELYDLIFVRPAKWLGRFLWKKGDGVVIDGFGPDGVSKAVVETTGKVVKLQTGYIYNYAFTMLIGVAALVTWYLFGGWR